MVILTSAPSSEILLYNATRGSGLDTRPHSAVLYAWAVVANGTRPWSEIEPWLQEIRASLPVHHPIASELAGEMAAELAEEHTRTIELSGQTLTLLKRHVSNIFGKLAVSNRTQAVARARAIRLLSIL
jgi:hypothetical protein